MRIFSAKKQKYAKFYIVIHKHEQISSSVTYLNSYLVLKNASHLSKILTTSLAPKTRQQIKRRKLVFDQVYLNLSTGAYINFYF